MKVRELKEAIKDMADDIEILGGVDGEVSEIARVEIENFTAYGDLDVKTDEECLRYTGKTIAEYERPYLYIELERI
ncbi:hypothetical protein GYN67_04855 [Lactococcus piscium]|uniref:hypothetical protein n=1 Tax=Pseudolactococcus carnosus TaxID=2749961 RepID=UPI001FB8945D|nr:hypothetical protein [Lactococcus carnosus]MCJ1996008.1 hypothetical protein [Lactococcus carnosus]